MLTNLTTVPKKIHNSIKDTLKDQGPIFTLYKFLLGYSLLILSCKTLKLLTNPKTHNTLNNFFYNKLDVPNAAAAPQQPYLPPAPPAAAAGPAPWLPGFNNARRNQMFDLQQNNNIAAAPAAAPINRQAM